MKIEETHEPLPDFAEKDLMRFNLEFIAYNIHQDYKKVGLFNKELIPVGEPKVFKLTECLTFEFIEDIDSKILGEQIKDSLRQLKAKSK